MPQTSQAYRTKAQERRALGAQWRADGWTFGQIAAEFQVRYRTTPLLAYRWAHDLTQREVAEALSARRDRDRALVDDRTVSLWERWPGAGGREPSISTLLDFAAVFHADLGELVAQRSDFRDDDAAFTGLAVASHDQSNRTPAEPEPGSTDVVAAVVRALGVLFDESEGPLKREHFLKLLAGVAAGGALAPGSLLSDDDKHMLGRVVDAPGTIGTEVVAPLRDLLGRYRQLDDLLGSKHVLQPVAGTVEMLRGLIPGASSEARPALLTLAGEAAQMAGWLSIDAGRHADARRYLGNALDWATAAGDQNLAAYVWTWRAEEAWERRDVTAAVSAAEAGEYAASLGVHPMVSVWATNHAARAFAVAGHNRSALGRLEDSERRFDVVDAGGAPEWMYHFDKPHLVEYRSRALLDLGMGQEAMSAISASLDCLAGSYVRDRGYHLTSKARALLVMGEASEACMATVEAVRIGRQSGSDGIICEAREVHAGLVDAERKTAAGRELTDLLRAPLQTT